jgi:isopropylmalate/homocitrate/citramalate synthase
MVNKNEIKEAGADWPVSFEDVEDDHLWEMLKLTPAQRLEMAEELLEFAVLAGAVKVKGSDPL